jgi:hypothetical protein
MQLAPAQLNDFVSSAFLLMPGWQLVAKRDH